MNEFEKIIFKSLKGSVTALKEALERNDRISIKFCLSSIHNSVNYFEQTRLNFEQLRLKEEE